MGENSGIQWTHHTFNPWIGCQRVSPGCVNCYAEHRNTFVRIQRKAGRELWGPRGDRHITADSNWRKPLSWNKAAAKAGRRDRVFCASLSDWAENRRDLDPPRARLYGLVDSTPDLDWLMLTKRIADVCEVAPEWVHCGFPPNVWLGTSVEDQRRHDERVPHLQGLPAAVRFLSCEPLLEPLTLDLRGIHWVIVGGESGDEARPFMVEWAESIIEQCKAAGVACFVKQLGGRARIGYYQDDDRFEQHGWDRDRPMLPDGTPWNTDFDGQPPLNTVASVKLRDSHGGDWNEWPEHLRVREWPTSAMPAGTP